MAERKTGYEKRPEGVNGSDAAEGISSEQLVRYNLRRAVERHRATLIMASKVCVVTGRNDYGRDSISKTTGDHFDALMASYGSRVRRR